MAYVLILGIFLAILFNFVNGLNDAANSIATVIATRVLTPPQAVGMAAFFNMIGPLFFTTAVAKTIGKEIVDPSAMTVHTIFIAVLIAVVWVFISSRIGIPISTSHALVGGILGSAIAAFGIGACLWPPLESIAGVTVVFVSGGISGGIILPAIARWKGESNWREYYRMGSACGVTLAVPILLATHVFVIKGILAIVLFIFISPALGFIASYLLCLLVMRIIARSRERRIEHHFNRLQVFSAAFYSMGHGSNDAQNAMGIITAMLFSAGMLQEFRVPPWVIVVSCIAISLGTLLGGWRVVGTMAKKITHLRPYQGFSAETAGGVVLSFITTFGIPVSTTHAISGAIMGVGATQGYAAVQWSVVRRRQCTP
ncbi:MAG: inorganic phosphate transporter [Methanomicrobiales archaeon]|nr:inorganic phosphate transporter [Methanomicrobiales archaeon]